MISSTCPISSCFSFPSRCFKKASACHLIVKSFITLFSELTHHLSKFTDNTLMTCIFPNITLVLIITIIRIVSPVLNLNTLNYYFRHQKESYLGVPYLLLNKWQFSRLIFYVCAPNGISISVPEQYLSGSGSL